MKKLLVTSSVAAAAFLATGVASHNADAAELNTTEQAKLVETALNNPAELNQHPLGVELRSSWNCSTTSSINF
ncbi:hypothetical protein [Staphylococcus carnosus]|uniref:Truncated SceE n=2 Tax=Staphylococcus carnosus TaxID=1281 RepID=O54495_STACA|nr:hypothetical protein [Staphylococcus carnosus]AAB94659.1 truncated SceE precursor [Staphylococcus carnosus]GEP78062.1 hypothetical protein SCA04_23760 [Staphylococcus carnosus]CAL28503.1 truncated SceE precursor (fragment 1) [Staphylococcus carnosus subsp. carnosus TM300]SUL90043.1 SceE (fragment 1) [Staphylococcus carnosus]